MKIIRNAWHFLYALIFVFKVVAVTSVLRRSPLNMALGLQSIQEDSFSEALD